MTGRPQAREPSARQARIAGAPISWGVCEVPGWGHQLAAERVLAEMQSLGLQATEAGPDGFLPGEPSAVRRVLAQHGLALAGGFVPLVLHDDDGWRDQLRRSAAHLAACGGEVIVLAAATGQDGYDARPDLNAAGWARLLRALDEAAAIAATVGLRAALHPHVGTMIERPEEIARVLADSGVPLCLDTGHARAAGCDPAALAREAAVRIQHVHLKDVRAEPAGLLAAGSLGYAAAVRAGLYCELGDGDAGIAGVVAALQSASYDGWYILEQDLMLAGEPPAGSGPCRAVDASLSFLRSALAGAA